MRARVCGVYCELIPWFIFHLSCCNAVCSHYIGLCYNSTSLYQDSLVVNVRNIFHWHLLVVVENELHLVVKWENNLLGLSVDWYEILRLVPSGGSYGSCNCGVCCHLMVKSCHFIQAQHGVNRAATGKKTKTKKTRRQQVRTISPHNVAFINILILP